MTQKHLKVGIALEDLQGQRTKSSYYVWDAAWVLPADYPIAGAPMGAALAEAKTTAIPLFGACTFAGIKEVLVSEISGFGGAVMGGGVGQSYPYGSDFIELEVLTEAGNRVHPQFPAPINAVMKLTADGKLTDVLNTANALVIELVGRLTDAGVCDTAGNQYQAIPMGHRDGTGAAVKNPGGE